MAIVLYGTLKRWVVECNYGFIREDSGRDIFIHVSGFADKIAPPQNTRLKFHLVDNPQKSGRQMAADAEIIVPRRIIAAQYSDQSEVL
jgi:cold shock CspA family protein